MWGRGLRAGAGPPEEHIIQRRLAVGNAVNPDFEAAVRDSPRGNLRWSSSSSTIRICNTSPGITFSPHRALFRAACCPLLSGVNQNVEPVFGDSTRIRPPCNSIMLLTIADPAPLPSAFGLSLSKTPNRECQQ